MVERRICRNCRKYIFDRENINPYEKVSAPEYATKVVSRKSKTNKTEAEMAHSLGLKTNWLVGKSDCELCGAPHAVVSYGGKIVMVMFYHSGSNEPSELDIRFIEDFKARFFAG